MAKINIENSLYDGYIIIGNEPHQYLNNDDPFLFNNVNDVGGFNFEQNFDNSNNHNQSFKNDSLKRENLKLLLILNVKIILKIIFLYIINIDSI